MYIKHVFNVIGLYLPQHDIDHKLRHHKWEHSTVAIWDLVAIWDQGQELYIATLEEGCNDNGNVFYVRRNFDINSKSRPLNLNKWGQSQIATTQ